MVDLRETLLEPGLDALEGLRPEHHAAHNKEGAPDRAWQQETADTGDDQQDADFLGQRPDPLDFLGITGFDGALYLVPATARVPVHFRPVQLTLLFGGETSIAGRSPRKA